jgi:hypothetical protein
MLALFVARRVALAGDGMDYLYKHYVMIELIMYSTLLLWVIFQFYVNDE